MKYLYVSMPDGFDYKIPADIIAKNRAEYYAKRDSKQDGANFDEIYQEEYDITMNEEYELEEWAAGNMNWEDVEKYAERLEPNNQMIDMENGWINGEKWVVDE